MIRTRSAEDQGLALTVIHIDGGTQSRAALNQQVVDDYAEAIQAGATFPPIVVFYDGKKHWLADGFHRFHAYQKAGREKVAADVRQGTCRDAILHSVGANETHGLRRTRDDKRRAVLTLLNDSEWGAKPETWIAETCHVSRTLVRAILTEQPHLVEKQDRSTVREVTRGGTTYAMQTAAIGKVGGDEKQEITSQTAAQQGGEGGDEPQKPVEEIAPRNIFKELVALWKEANPGEQEDFRAYIKGSEFVAKFGLRQESKATDTTGGGDVDRSATRASSAVEVGATNSPDGADETRGGLPVAAASGTAEETGRTPAYTRTGRSGTPTVAGVTGGESAASSEGSHQSALVSDMADRGNASDDESVTAGETASNSHSSEPSSSQALTDSPVLTSSPASGTPFNNPRCQKPETCHLAHSRNECFECNLAWAKRPREEQVRLWAEAVQAARAA